MTQELGIHIDRLISHIGTGYIQQTQNIQQTQIDIIDVNMVHVLV